MFRRLITPLSLALALAVLVVMSGRPVRADLALQLDQPTYVINGVGNTVAVTVNVRQVAGSLVNAGPGNALISAGFLLSFNAAIGKPISFTAGAGWDSATVDPLGTSPVGVTLLSLGGFTNFASPVKLGTFVFQGVAAGGPTPITVGDLDPGSPDFITENGDILDSSITNVTSQLTVNTTAAVPEPSPLWLGGVALGMSLLYKRWRA